MWQNSLPVTSYQKPPCSHKQIEKEKERACIAVGNGGPYLVHSDRRVHIRCSWWPLCMHWCICLNHNWYWGMRTFYSRQSKACKRMALMSVKQQLVIQYIWFHFPPFYVFYICLTLRINDNENSRGILFPEGQPLTYIILQKGYISGHIMF